MLVHTTRKRFIDTLTLHKTSDGCGVSDNEPGLKGSGLRLRALNISPN